MPGRAHLAKRAWTVAFSDGDVLGAARLQDEVVRLGVSWTADRHSIDLLFSLLIGLFALGELHTVRVQARVDT